MGEGIGVGDWSRRATDGPHAALTRAEAEHRARCALAVLEAIDQRIVGGRIVGETYAEIGDIVGLCAERVRQREARAIRHMSKLRLFPEAMRWMDRVQALKAIFPPRRPTARQRRLGPLLAAG